MSRYFIRVVVQDPPLPDEAEREWDCCGAPTARSAFDLAFGHTVDDLPHPRIALEAKWALLSHHGYLDSVDHKGRKTRITLEEV